MALPTSEIQAAAGEAVEDGAAVVEIAALEKEKLP